MTERDISAQQREPGQTPDDPNAPEQVPDLPTPEIPSPTPHPHPDPGQSPLG